MENLSEYFVKSPEEIGRLLKSGKKKLAIAETKMNRQSSRLVNAVIYLIITIQVNEPRGDLTPIDNFHKLNGDFHRIRSL